MAKISFIIPTKNRSEVLKQALESLLAQTENDWEAIIVDDQSSDNTKEMIVTLNDLRFKYFLLLASMTGTSEARNFACLQAQAPIVAILDDDDICYPERVKETLKAFEDPEVDVFYSNLDIWDVDKNEIRDRKTPVIDFDLEIFKQKDFIPHSTVAMRKQILLDNLYDSSFKIAEDYDLLSRLAVQGKVFYYCPKKLIKYRLWSKNTFSEKRKEEAQFFTKLVQKNRGWL